MQFILFFLLPILLCLTALGVIRFCKWPMTVGELLAVIVLSTIPVINLVLFFVLCMCAIGDSGILAKQVWKGEDK